MKRTAVIDRETKETKISMTLDLDGGEVSVKSGIGFFDHMLTSLAFHAGFGLEVEAWGDVYVDGHHTVEDVGIVLGQALKQALGDKSGIVRFADVHVPMDEALCFAAIDISGRAFLVFDSSMPQETIGGYDTCLTEEFMRAFAYNAGITLHLRTIYGGNAHHTTEALFKAVGRSLRQAVKIEGTGVSSTKGAL